MAIDELELYLDSLEFVHALHIVQTLKVNTAETTELVYHPSNPDKLLICKRIKRGFGLGEACEDLYHLFLEGVPHHDFLPRLLAYAPTESEIILVREYIEGETLEKCVEKSDNRVQFVCDSFSGILDSVIFLHECLDTPIIHRDINPSNILMSSQGPLIIDFGIARRYHDSVKVDSSYFGTPSFIPPEQYGFAQTDVRSDVYSLGILLGYCLLGEVPTADLRYIGLNDSRILVPFRKVIMKATEFNPDARYITVREMKDAYMRAQAMVLKHAQNESGGYDFSSYAITQEKLFRHYHGERIIAFEVLGYIWNALLISALAIFAIRGSIQVFLGATIPGLEALWFKVATFYLFGFIPGCAVTYLVFDKSHLRRKFKFFRKRSFLDDLKVVLSIIVCCFALLVVLALVLQML